MRLRSREPLVDLEVRNPVHRTSYRVLFPEYPGRDAAFCSCTDFARRGLGTCKHVEAAWSWLQSAAKLPEAPLPLPERRAALELWREVDRRLGELGRAPIPTIREVERPGELLFEPVGVPASVPRKTGGASGRARADRSASTTSSRARA